MAPRYKNSNFVDCAVCSRPTTFFNYGVVACNSCKMFFKRCMESTRPVICKFQHNCYVGPEKSCRGCRYDKCIQVGMNCRLSIERCVIKDYDELSLLLRKLTDKNANRLKKFQEYHVAGDVSLDSAFRHNFRFVRRSENLQMTFFRWGVVEQMTSIDFMKKLELFKNLDSPDQITYLRGTYFGFSVLCHAIRNYLGHRDCFGYPYLTSWLDELQEANVLPQEFLLRVRCRLVGKLIELKVTNEEFLLTSVVLFSNPDIPNLSEPGKEYIFSVRRHYSSLLLQYCQMKYRHDGPTRFLSLISLSAVINASVHDIGNLFRCYQVFVTQKQLPGFYGEMLNGIFENEK